MTNNSCAWQFYWLALLFLLAIFTDTRAAYFGHPSAIDLFDAVLLPTAVTMCCVTDARARRHPVPMSIQSTMLLTWPVAVPVYLVRERRLTGVAIGIGLTVAWIVICIVSALAATVAIGLLHRPLPGVR